MTDLTTRDRANCTVLALAAVTGAPYDDCRQAAIDIANERDHYKRRKWPSWRGWSEAFDAGPLLGFRFTRHLWRMEKFGRGKKGGLRVDGYGPTLAEFCRRNPSGTFYVAVRGHALAVRDGAIIDYTQGSGRKVGMAYRVEAETAEGWAHVFAARDAREAINA